MVKGKSAPVPVTLLMTIPVGAILWFELLHLAFGMTSAATDDRR